MKKQEYQQLCNLLTKRQAELEKQLAENDYSDIISVAISKHEQIQAINILMAQLQYLAEL